MAKLGYIYQHGRDRFIALYKGLDNFFKGLDDISRDETNKIIYGGSVNGLELELQMQVDRGFGEEAERCIVFKKKKYR